MDPPHFQTSHLVRAQPPCYWYALQTPQDLSRGKYPTFDILPDGAYSLEKTYQIEYKQAHEPEFVQSSSFQTKKARQNETTCNSGVKPSKGMVHIKQEPDNTWPPEFLKANLNISAVTPEAASSLELDFVSKSVKPDTYFLHQSYPRCQGQGFGNTKPSENNTFMQHMQHQGNEKRKIAVGSCSIKAQIGKSFQTDWGIFPNQDAGIRYTVQCPSTEYEPDPFFDFPQSISEDNIFLTDLSPSVFSRAPKPRANPRFEVLNDDITHVQPQPKAETQALSVSGSSQPLSIKASAKMQKKLTFSKARGAQSQTSATKTGRSLHDVTNYPFFAYNVAAGSEDGAAKSRRYIDASAPPQVNTPRNTKVKAYRCIICHKSFKRPSSYRIHYTIHSGEKRFRCFECGRCFNVKSNLTRHERLHNKPDGFRRSQVDLDADFAERG